MGPEERQTMLESWDRDFAPLARGCAGFRGVQFVHVSDEEVMTVWQWDREADWQAAQAPFGPFLQQHVIPNLAGPPDRVGGEVVLQLAP
jgi:hypothetical protein